MNIMVCTDFLLEVLFLYLFFSSDKEWEGEQIFFLFLEFT